jgi:hypothetical protein
MKPFSLARAVGAGGIIVLPLLIGSPSQAPRASPRIDTTHTVRDRLTVDSCILGAIIIYTDPYIGARFTNDQIVANIAQLCAQPFGILSEDLRLDSAAAQRTLRQTIEAGLRGQLREEAGRPALRNAQ